MDFQWACWEGWFPTTSEKSQRRFPSDQISGRRSWKSIFCHRARTETYEGEIAEKELIAGSSSVWKIEQKAFAICYHTDGTEAQRVIIKEEEEEVLFADVFLPLVLQQLYLHGLHHKLSWSSPNKARHFFGVFASVSRTGRHKHTHRDDKTKKNRKKRKWTRHCTDKNMWPGLRLRLATLGYSPPSRPPGIRSSQPKPASFTFLSSCNKTPATPSR